MATRLTVSTEFYNEEKLRNKEPRNLFDPESIEVNIIDSENRTLAKPTPLRLSMGKYIAHIDSDLLIEGSSYEVRWIYYIYPGSYQIQRHSFTYNATHPTISGMCRIFGTISPMGVPVSNAVIEASVVKDGYSKHFETARKHSLSNVFGQWDIYLPVGERSNIIIVETNENKYFQVPNSSSYSFSSISSLVVTYTATDSFGNPV